MHQNPLSLDVSSDKEDDSNFGIQTCIRYVIQISFISVYKIPLVMQ